MDKSNRACQDPLLLIVLIRVAIPVNNAPRTLNVTPSILKTYINKTFASSKFILIKRSVLYAKKRKGMV